jgi:hypothetical protein
MSRRSSLRKAVVFGHLTRSAPLGTSQWRVAKSLLALRATVDTAHPGRNKASDGTIGDASHASRDSDHNPWVKDGLVGVVTAIDITHDPMSGCDANRIVASLVSSRDRRIKYVIWNRQILSASVSPWLWRSYSGRNPHTSHFHLSVVPSRSQFDDEAQWSIAGGIDDL